MIRQIDSSLIDDFEIVSDINPFTKFYGYYSDDCLVALLEFSHMYERLEVVNIFVKDSFRKKGIASMLMEELINYGKKNNCYNITLEVNCLNSNAISLYKKYDFKEVGIRRKYYNGVDGLLMELIL